MLLDEKTLKESSVMDKTVEDFMKNNPAPAIPWDDAAACKQIMQMVGEQMKAQVGPAEATLVEEYKDIPMRDGFQNKAKIIRPSKKPAEGSPLIVFYFGGGFISGDNEAGTPFARAWARLFGAVSVLVSYRLAPEHKFPVPLYDGIDNGQWIAEHASDLGADPSKGFIIGGISAGGTQAANTTLASISQPFAVPVTGQWLCVPALMDEKTVPSKYKGHYLAYEHNKDVPVLPAAAITAIDGHLQSDKSSPLRFPVLNEVPLAKVPRTFLQSDGMDPLRDDALIYEEMLKEAGVETRMNFYPGCPHAHFAFTPGIDVSNKALADIVTGMGWLLGKEISVEQALGSMVPSA